MSPISLVRVLFFVAGVVSLALGIAGIFLPVLPTTPLVLLAATCFARSYRPLHEWLLNHRVLGPTLRDWYEHRSLKRRTKLVAITTMAAGLGASIVFFVEPIWLDALLVGLGIVLGVWLYRLPTREK
jgi:uncharacterized membrane protein YbaN (DUF454 family)